MLSKANIFRSRLYTDSCANQQDLTEMNPFDMEEVAHHIHGLG